MVAPAQSSGSQHRPAPVETLASLIEAACDSVYDPCSLAANAPISIHGMGLVRGWRFDEETGHLHLTLTVTAPGCTMVMIFVPKLREKLLDIPAVETVEVKIDASVLWAPDMISEDGQATLARSRERGARLRAMLVTERG